MATTLRNLKQKRQEFAYDNFVPLPTNVKEDYKTLCEKLTMQVYNNSLISAIAWLKADKDSAPQAMYRHIGEWLEKVEIINLNDNGDLLEKLIKMENYEKLRLCTKEIMLLADVLKEIAKAETQK